VVATGTATIVPGVTDTGNHTDDGTTNIALPFAYNLYGVAYNAANVDSNGTLSFVSTASTFTNACLPTASYNTTIFALWDDQRTDQVQTACASYAGGCGIFTTVEGVAPNRIFDIEWRAAYYDASGRFTMSYACSSQVGSR